MSKAWIQPSLQFDYFTLGGCPHSFKLGSLIDRYPENENVLSKYLGLNSIEGIHSRLLPNQPLKSTSHASNIVEFNTR